MWGYLAIGRGNVENYYLIYLTPGKQHRKAQRDSPDITGTWFQTLVSPINSCVASAKLLNLSEPLSSWVKSEEHHPSLGLLWGLDETTCVRDVAWTQHTKGTQLMPVLFFSYSGRPSKSSSLRPLLLFLDPVLGLALQGFLPPSLW